MQPSVTGFDAFLHAFARASSRRDVLDALVNGLRTFIRADQVAVVHRRAGGYRLLAVSNAPDLQGETSYAVFIRTLMGSAARIGRFGPWLVSEFADDPGLWARHSPPAAFLVAPGSVARRLGLAVFSQVPLDASEQGRVETALLVAAARIDTLKWGRRLDTPVRRRLLVAAGVAAVLGVTFLPVPDRVTLRAELKSGRAIAVTAPFDAVISKVLVTPGKPVLLDDALVELDHRQFRADEAMQVRAVSAARTELERLERLRFSSPNVADRLMVAEAELATAMSALQVTRDRLGQLILHATTAGIAVFADPALLEGKPVRAGEMIFQIGETGGLDAEFTVPLTETFRFVGEKVPELTFFADSREWSGQPLAFRYCEYEPRQDPFGLVGNACRARLSAPEGLGIGGQGVVIVSGASRPLGELLLRRPFSYLRTSLGL